MLTGLGTAATYPWADKGTEEAYQECVEYFKTTAFTMGYTGQKLLGVSDCKSMVYGPTTWEWVKVIFTDRITGPLAIGGIVLLGALLFKGKD